MYRQFAWMTTAAAMGMLLAAAVPARGQEAAAGIKVDKQARSVTIPCKVAPRKLPNLPEVYPLEVIASYPAPKGQKAHETILTFEVKPSEVHQALVSLGLQPGKPARGEGAAASGPEVSVSLEVPAEGGQVQRLPIERLMVDRKTGKAMPKLKWIFTGSVFKQPDPEKPEKAFAADLTGTLIAIFPVTDETVLQTNLTMKEEKLIKLEVNKKLLPAEGSPVQLVIEAK